MSDEVEDGPVTERTEEVDGRLLHWLEAGVTGSPILLVHGFPETSRVFRRLIPLLAASHRVVAVDLPGFGGSGSGPGDCTSAAAASALHALIARLDLGPVHLSGQDVGGDTVFRLAVEHPEDVRSLVAVETALAGFGFEALADVAHGGAWHVGAIATPGVGEFVFSGRMRRWLEESWFPAMTRVEGAVTPEDVDAFARAYERPGAWHGPQGLYRAALEEGDELRALATSPGLRVPVLAVNAMSAPFTTVGMRSVSDRVTEVVLEGVGHHVALEAPERLAAAMLSFTAEVDAAA